MAAIKLNYIPQFATTTLNVPGGITSVATAGIILTSVPTDIDITKPGILCFSYANPLVTTAAEFVRYTSIDGSNELQGVTRGTEGYSAKAHANGVTVAWIVSKSHINEIMDGLGGVSTGVSLNTPVLTTPKVTTSINDSSGNEVIKTPATASAVNEITVTNAATGSAPSITATGGDTNINLILSGKGTGGVITAINAPQGFLINGKISATVASNNITVAIKGIDGNDPSSSNPVYCRIGDTVRSITSALSVTKNAGTNWFGEGGNGPANHYVYLGYNATDGATIGFSPIIDASRYGDFSATSTNDRYCAISTITNAASTDYYEQIGMFVATLSAAASYNWSVPTFGAYNLIQHPVKMQLVYAKSTPLGSAFNAGAGTSEQEVTGLRTSLPILNGLCTIVVTLKAYWQTVTGNNQVFVRLGTSTTYLSNSEVDNVYYPGSSTPPITTHRVLTNQDLSTQTYGVIGVSNDTNASGMAMSAANYRTSFSIEIYMPK